MNTLHEPFRWFLFSQLIFAFPWIIPFREELQPVIGLDLFVFIDPLSSFIGFVFLLVAVLKIKKAD